MYRFLCLGSGSSGNCYYLEHDDDAIIIDAGIGIRKIKKQLKDYGISTAKLKAIIITHDHSDHIKAAGYMSNEYGLPVYATEKVHKAIAHHYKTLKPIDQASAKYIEKDKEFPIGSFRITAFDIPHDSTENVGYTIHTDEEDDGIFTIMTDVGAPTESIKQHIANSNFLVIEANYDEEMLRNGKYPLVLQERITSGNGHLSNRQTAEMLAENFHEGIRNVFLCHLSEENNHPELARKTIEMKLHSYGIIAGKDFSLDVLKRHVPSGEYILKL